MRKLRLEVEDLQVESFVAGELPAERGSVQGLIWHRDPESTDCDGPGWGSLFGSCDCPTVGTCIGPTYCCPRTWRTCNPSCDASCPEWECGL